MTYKDFDAAYKEQQKEPIRFKAGGEEFQVTDVPAGALLRLARLSEAEESDVVKEFDNLCRALIPSVDHERWNKALDNVSTQTLIEIVEFLIEESTGRPLDQPSVSRAARRANGQRSNTASRRTAKRAS